MISSKAKHDIIMMMERIRRLDDCDFISYWIAYHAAAVISGYKPAALVCLRGWGRNYAAALRKSAKSVADTLEVKLCAVKTEENALTLLIYSPQLLSQTLSHPEAVLLLRENAYLNAGSRLSALLGELRQKSRDGAIPHEIGLFLGYPAHDVRCFIEKGAGSCTVSGCWKAYQNVESAQCCFSRWNGARLHAAELIAKGADLPGVAGELMEKRQLVA